MREADARDMAPAGRPLTGRMVLLCLLAFFGVVFAVNAIMVRAAISTFGGAESVSAYKAGLAFNHEIEAARRQDARHWAVTAHVARNGDGLAAVEVTVSAPPAMLPADVSAQVSLAHPTDGRRDHPVEVTQVRPGVFRGAVAAEAGQWDLLIDLSRGEERLFRSRNRIALQ